MEPTSTEKAQAKVLKTIRKDVEQSGPQPKALGGRQKVLRFFLVCALIIGGGYAACSILYPTIEIRYRLSLYFDVDGVQRVGSGVIEIEYDTAAAFERSIVTGGSQGLVGFMRGNAITVDLGDRGLLLVVDTEPCVGGPGPQNPREAWRLSDLPLRLFYMGPHPNVEGTAFLRAAQHQSGVRNVPLEKLPLLVRLGNVQDRNAAQRVDPFDLTAAFGPGVKLVRATLEVTSDPISPTPSNWPSWLKDQKGDARLYIPDANGKISVVGCYLSAWMFKGLP
jgi:hypothetical protein